MKKFEGELFSEVPCKFGLSTEGEYKQSILVKHFGGWVSPEDHQNTVASNKALEKSNRTLSEENAKFVVENIELQKQIAELKSQLEKQQPEIPEVVAELIKYAKENRKTIRWCLYGNCKDLYPQAAEWIGADDDIEFTEKTLKQQETFVHAWLNGYTVKGKRFYLKHIEMSKRDVHHDYYAQIRNERFEHDSIETGTLPQPVITGVTFTQQEIDSMAADSYEKIEVEE